jgi:hypothetical protein
MNLNVSEAPDGEVENQPADFTVAPGGTLSLSIPDSIANNPDVDHVVLSDLPAGATVSSGIEDADGNYVISGDLSQNITVNLGSDFEGDVTLSLTGNNVLDTPVDGASESISVEVDDTYAMQGSSADTANGEAVPESESTDWTTADNTGTTVDVMDDSSSFTPVDDPSTTSAPSDDMSGF